MPKVTEAHLEARRKQILDAASGCFARQGFHQTTMQDICREAELSPGAVYRYFASKEEIIAASCQQCQQESLALIESAAAHSDNPVEVLDWLVDSAFTWLGTPEAVDHMRINVQLWAEALRNPEVMDAFQEANFGVWRNALADLVRRAQERGEVNPELSAESTASLLLSTWHGLVLQRAFDNKVDIAGCVAALKIMYKAEFVGNPFS